MPLELVPFEQAGQVFEAVARDAWDVAFLAIDPKRAAQIEFTPPYVIIEGGYAVRHDSPLRAIGDVDRSGVRVSVIADSAYDLYLTRTLTAATVVRSPRRATRPSRGSTRTGWRCWRGSSRRSPRSRAARGDLRVMDGRFMAIEQAMGVPKARAAGAAYLRAMLEELKASGFVGAELARSGQHDAQVGPPAP